MCYKFPTLLCGDDDHRPKTDRIFLVLELQCLLMCYSLSLFPLLSHKYLFSPLFSFIHSFNLTKNRLNCKFKIKQKIHFISFFHWKLIEILTFIKLNYYLKYCCVCVFTQIIIFIKIGLQIFNFLFETHLYF